jgi:hypothetical protein
VLIDPAEAVSHKANQKSPSFSAIGGTRACFSTISLITILELNPKRWYNDFNEIIEKIIVRVLFLSVGVKMVVTE